MMKLLRDPLTLVAGMRSRADAGAETDTYTYHTYAIHSSHISIGQCSNLMKAIWRSSDANIRDAFVHSIGCANPNRRL